jgi:hypothetical protein
MQLREEQASHGTRRYAVHDARRMFDLFKVKRHQVGRRACADPPNEWLLAELRDGPKLAETRGAIDGNL